VLAVTLLLLAAVKATVLIAVALLVVSCARRASAALRHAILLAAMIGSLILPPLAATLPTLNPFPNAGDPNSASPELRRWSDRAVQLVLIRSDTESVLPLRADVRTTAERRRVAILLVWFAGTTFALLRILADLAAAHRSRRRATRRGRVGSGIPLLESTEIGAPVVVGLFRPAIMLPIGTTAESAALQPMITHELAHIERRDCLTQLVVRIACAFYWFNPIAWYAAQRIALEREGACDDHALMSGVDPIDYSELLIDVARQNAHTVVPFHAAPLMPQAAHLEKRIVRILDASAARGRMSRPQMVAVAIVAGTIVAPLAALGVRDRPSFAEQSDVFFDPQSERVAGIRDFDPAAPPADSNTPDGALITVLHAAAAREPRGSYDLVPDRARWALSMVRDGAVIEPLIGALHHDPDWRVRGYAAWALATSGDARAVEPLILLLDHSVWRLRAMAASALRRIGDPRAAAALGKALDDPAWQVRVEAVAYFGALREQDFMERIEPLRNDPHIAVRLAADEALSSMQ
jgi:beta-lactamase regulating signal transducer with metallopeptidase domain